MKTILCSMALFVLAIMYYAIGFGIKALHGDFYMNFLLYSSLNIPFSILPPILAQNLGRRWALVSLFGTASAFGMTIVIVNFTATSDISGNVITWLAIMNACLFDQAWAILNTFMSELFPTSVRILAVGHIYFWGRMGSIVSPFLIPRHSSELYVSYLVMALMAGLECVFVLLLPETLNREMEETINETNIVVSKSSRRDNIDDKDIDPLKGENVKT